MSEQTIAPEVAQQEFERFADAWDIETDTSHMDDDSREDFDKLTRTILRAIESGRAHVDDDGSLTFNLKHPVGDTNALTFRVPKGVDYMAMDAYKDKETAKKLFAFMASLTKQNVKFFGSMSGPDIKFAQAVTNLFMGS